MTTTASGRKATAVCDGATTAFAVPFQFQEGGLAVYLLDAAGADNEAGDLLTEGVHYTVSGDGEAGTATVTTATAYPVGKFLRRWRQTPLGQLASYTPNDGFPAKRHEAELDRLSMVTEELADDKARLEARAVKVPAGDVAPVLPSLASIIGKVLGVSAGAAIVGVTMGGADAALRTDLAGPIGMELVGQTFAGVGPVQKSAKQIAENAVPFEIFLPTNYVAENSVHAQKAAAAAWSVMWQRPVLFSRVYQLDQNVTLDNLDGFHFHYQGARFNLAAAITNGTLTNGAAGKIGLLVKNCDDAQMTGRAKWTGQNAMGVGSTCALIFDSCARLAVGDMAFEQLSAGMFVAWCDHGQFGNLRGLNLNGQQTFDPVGSFQGSALVAFGCRYTQWGNITSDRNFKPIVYFSVMENALGQRISNAHCQVGNITGSTYPGSLQGNAVMMRSGVQCGFGHVSGTGFVTTLLIVRYGAPPVGGDSGYELYGNSFASVTGSVPESGASVDAVVTQESFDTALCPIGTNYIGYVNADAGTGAGSAEFGILITHGTLVVKSARINGGDRPVAIYSGGALVIGSLIISSPGGLGSAGEAPVVIGPSGSLVAQFIDLTTGSAAPAASASGVRYDPTFPGSPGIGTVAIDTIRYRHNATLNNLKYVVFDPDNGAEKWAIRHIDGVGSSGQALFASADAIQFRNGQRLSAAKPTAGAYTAGTYIENSAPAIDGNNMVLTGWRKIGTDALHVANVNWALQYASTVTPAT